MLLIVLRVFFCKSSAQKGHFFHVKSHIFKSEKFLGSLNEDLGENKRNNKLLKRHYGKIATTNMATILACYIFDDDSSNFTVKTY